MSSTRENMRRELKELAKMAELKRQETSPDLRSSGAWSVFDPDAIAEVAGDDASAEGAQAARPSSVTVPPVMSPAPRASASAIAHRSRGGSVAIVVASAAVGVVICTALLGRTVARTHAASGAAPIPAATEAVVVLPAPPPEHLAAPLPADSPTADLPTETARSENAPAGAASSPTPSTPSPPARHRIGGGGGAAARPVKIAAPPRSAPAGATPAGPQSLDDLMRKAVNQSQ
jgi:hypothetical protein